MKTYKVKEHDTLWKISRKEGVSIEAIAAANKLKGRKIHQLSIDQILLIPEPQDRKGDTKLSVGFRGLDHGTVTPKRVKVEYDGRVEEHKVEGGNPITLFVQDHARGLKVWVENLQKELEQTFSADILPIGEWKLNIDSRKVKAEGAAQPQKGKQQATTQDVKSGTTHNAQVRQGQASHQQARVESGKPVHAVASIYTADNLRLAPANEKYRTILVDTAKRHGLTPQSLAALINAEAAKARKTGEWLERSNESSPDKAQGLAQFFEAAWNHVGGDSSSLLHAECQKLSKRDFLAKRLVAKYAIDAAAVYALINLRDFEKKTGKAVTTLPPEDKAKVAYILHHEGLTGALQTLKLCGKSRSANDSRARLIKQLGEDHVDKVDELIEQYDGDAAKAYQGWLFGYTDAKINVNTYIVDDAKKFANPPRSTADIFAGLGSASVKPTPRPPAKPPASAPAPAAKPAPAPAAKPAPAPKAAPAPAPAAGAPSGSGTSATSAAGTASAAGASGSWHAPLASCKLRTAGLSATGARFGWTRQNGKKKHQGIDLIAVPGTPIYAVADGLVYKRPAAKGAAYGHTLILVVDVNDLPQAQRDLCKKVAPKRTHIGFFYAHLEEMIEGKNPVPVEGGVEIGKSGESGNAKGMNTVAKGAHLHFEVRLDPLKMVGGLENRTDPLPFITLST